MTNEFDHNENAQNASIDALFEQSPPNIAALLRAHADGELTPQQADRLKQILSDRSELAQQAPTQVALEQVLRKRCDSVMGQVTPCPQHLRQRITQLAAASATSTTQSAGADDPGYAERIERASDYTRDRSFWARSPLMSIAAVILLSVAGVLIWQSTGFTSNAVTHRQGMTIEQAAYTDRVGGFVLREHNRCCDDKAAQAKLVRNDINAAIEYFSDSFGQPVQLPDMAQADGRIEFYGGGDCAVPQTTRSGHLRFDSVDDQGNAIALSLFIMPDPGIIPLDEGVTYSVRSKACDEAGARLFTWVSQGVQYMLVSEASDSDCASVRGIMNAPERLARI